MVDYGGTAARAIDLVAAFLTAGDPAGADPQGTIRSLADFVAQCFDSSQDASALYARFQQEPSNPDLRMAVRGRLTEAMLLDASFSEQLQSVLSRVESTSGPSNTMGQQTFTNTGQIRGSAINQGSGTIDQSRRFKISLPIAGLALLASGVLAGGGVAIYSAVNGDAGEYVYSITPTDNPGSDDFSLLSWTTDSGGQLHGAFEEWQGTSTRRSNLAVVGSQHGNSVTLTMTGRSGSKDVNISTPGVLNGNTLTLGLGGKAITMHKTTRDQFNKTKADWK